ncbi:MAG TPA: response regulator [Flavitalea sp.]|nr:response regulator [Flavitalea sp.]
MTNSNEDAIWIVDDDSEDHDLITEIFKELKYENPLRFFNGAKSLLKALKEVPAAPFIIICDVNLPGTDGFELKEKLLQTPNNKFHSVPFIFWSTYASEEQIRKAYELRGHGFFIKEPNYEDWKTSFCHILEYWRRSRVPSKEDKPDKPLI